MRKNMLFCFLLFIVSLAARAEGASSLTQAAHDPKGVADLFLSCPFVGIDDTAPTAQGPNDAYGHLVFSNDPVYGSEKQFRLKQELLTGSYVSLDVKDPVTTLIVDEQNGYLHIADGAEASDLVIVYYKHVDGSLIPALRYENDDGPFPFVTWGFYDLKGGEWRRIPDGEILPKDWERAFIPSGVSGRDEDLLSVTGWDLALPQFGTTARLSPMQYESDLDDPRNKIPLAGSDRVLTQGDYYAWFQKNMYLDGKLKALELKWNKPQRRFDSGKVVGLGS